MKISGKVYRKKKEGRRKPGGVGLNHPTAQPGAEETRWQWKVPEYSGGTGARTHWLPLLLIQTEASRRFRSQLGNYVIVTMWSDREPQIGVQSKLSADLQ